VVVVDSGSRDGSLEVAARLADRVIELEPGTYSPGRALNRGALAATGDVVFALSSHCRLRSDDWIERSLADYERPDVAATNGSPNGPDDRPFEGVFYQDAAHARAHPQWGFSNHASSWRQSVWLEHHFDEEVTHSEDRLWAIDVTARGWVVAFDPSLWVEPAHRWKQGARSFLRRERRELIVVGSHVVLPPYTFCDVGERLVAADSRRPPFDRVSPAQLPTCCGVDREVPRAPGGQTHSSLSPSASPTISVVMPTYHRRHLLARVLEPLLAEPDALEVIVVVDGSRDGSYELLQTMAVRDKRLRPILIDNRGMGEARLAGARAATGEVVLLLDDDVRVAPGTVAGHARHHAAAERLVVVGGMPVSGGPQRGWRDFPRARYAKEYLRRCEHWLADPESILCTFWEGHLSMRRRDLLALEAPAVPEIARGYHGDVDFGLRCLHAGLTGVFDPSLRAEHLYSRDPAAFLRDAHNSGFGWARLHRFHAEDLGPLTDDFALAGLAWPGRALVRRARSRRWPTRVLALLVRVLGVLRAYRVQGYAAGLRWRVEQERAIRECGLGAS
jgi:glycosyltransferase involved in cell wall biosynthesis